MAVATEAVEAAVAAASSSQAAGARARPVNGIKGRPRPRRRPRALLTNAAPTYKEMRTPAKTTGSSVLLVVLVAVAVLAPPSARADQPLLSSPRMMLQARVPKSSSASASELLGCKSVPSMKTFKYLNRICEDCFQLFRDQELYHMCRSDCFGSRYFVGCMDALLVETDARVEAAGIVDDMHAYVKKK